MNMVGKGMGMQRRRNKARSTPHIFCHDFLPPDFKLKNKRVNEQQQTRCDSLNQYEYDSQRTGE